MTEHIEREAAKRAIMSQYLSRANKTKYADVIDAVPAADVAPVKHGKWIHLVLMPDDVTGHTYGECSHCRKLRIVDNFCPNCGAKMDLEE